MSASEPFLVQSAVIGLDSAKTDGHGRIVYVSSGPNALAANMIDNDPGTAFRFSKSDLHPTVIMELPQNEPVHGIKLSSKANGAGIAVYLTSEMPPGKGDFDFVKPVTSLKDCNEGNAAIEFDTHDARYVTLRWTRQTVADEPVRVSEVTVLGEPFLDDKESPAEPPEASADDSPHPTFPSTSTFLILPEIPMVSPL
jgi:hypothetical protein